jgi:hypothetical protein
LRQQLLDASGALPLVLSRHVKESDLLLNNLDQPLVVLASYIQRLLNSEHLLADFVREVDTHWGRVLLERPHFELAGRAAHPDDPYTIASVRTKLSDLVAKLAKGEM